MYNKDLYANQTSGYKISPLLLNSSLIVAKPISSGEQYSLISNIWDKKGEGAFSAEMDFTVVSNPNIDIESDELTAKEIYLTSVTKNDIITETTIGFNEKIQLNIEGLKGFKEINGEAEINLSMKVTDDDGNIIIENNNLLGDAPRNAELVKQNLSATLIMQKGRLSNPITCLVTVTDRTNNSKMTSKSELTVE
jgi:hypothetical protein